MESKAICSREGAVAEAVRKGRWNQSLETHAADCVRCREVMQAARAMQSLAFSPEPDHSMPEASRIWCLALLEQKQRETTRARRSLAAVELVVTTLMVFAAVSWLAWKWPDLLAQLTVWQSNPWPQLWQAGWFLVEQMLASLPAMPMLFLLLAAAAFLLAQPLFAED